MGEGSMIMGVGDLTMGLIIMGEGSILMGVGDLTMGLIIIGMGEGSMIAGEGDWSDKIEIGEFGEFEIEWEWQKVGWFWGNDEVVFNCKEVGSE